MEKTNSAYFTLMCEFKLGKDVKFEGFIDYIIREDVKPKKKNYKIKNSSATTTEQQNLNETDFSRYLSYMSRKNALEKKPKLTIEEKASLEFVKGKTKNYYEMLRSMKESTHQINIQNDLKTGMFNLVNDDFSNEDVNKAKKHFKEAQANGSVLWKDVISFKTEALIATGVYNPHTNELDRKPLIEASRRMIKEMYRREHLDVTGITVAEIHYNTNNFHIHFATVESKNTRRLMEINGVMQPRGKRKASTIQAMKSTFANYIFDRSLELEKISKLRNSLRQSVIYEMLQLINQPANEPVLKLLNNLKKSLPHNRKLWNSKNLSEESQTIMHDLIDALMKNNFEFNKYKNLVKQEDKHRQQLYGTLKGNKSSFYEGRLYGKPDGLYYRLSNSILEELRKSSRLKERSRKIVAKELARTNPQINAWRKPKINIDVAFKIASYQLKKLEYITDNRFKEYKIAIERHKLERDIERARWERSL